MLAFCISASLLLTSGCTSGREPEPSTAVTEYEMVTYNTDLWEENLYAERLCVAQGAVSLDGFPGDEKLHAAALFDLSQEQVLYAYKIHERIYPASVTKIMTALLVLEKGNLQDKVKISSTAAAANFPSGAQLCGLKAGEEWTVEDLLNALLLYSGNDAGQALAEYIAGSSKDFVQMMNQRAKELMANNTHFMNAHGLHDAKHYTTAYDIYLIFKECIKNEQFVNIIQSESYMASYITTDGKKVKKKFAPTNYYAKGLAEKPKNVTVVGGKTGTTPEAGNCLVLLEKDDKGGTYVSVVMGAPDKTTLYVDMTKMMEAIPENTPAGKE